MNRQNHIPKYIRIKNRYLVLFIVLGILFGPYIGQYFGHLSLGIVGGVAGGVLIGIIVGGIASRPYMTEEESEETASSVRPPNSEKKPK